MRRMDRRIAAMAAAILICAVLVVEVRHESRMLFTQVQGLQAERDALNTEWEKLLLEEGTWGQHRRVEEAARMRLDMAIPGHDRIVVVTAPGVAPP